MPSSPIGFIGLNYNPLMPEKASLQDLTGLVIDRPKIDCLHAGKPSNQAVTLDELAVILHKHAKVKIDSSLGWHLWATDLCLQDWFFNGKPTAEAIQVPVFHNSTLASIPCEWHDSAKILAQKWPDFLPLRTLCGVVK